MRPSLSLVTPVLNGARFLPHLLEAIRAQRVKPLEYIVVDGGSTDGTLEILGQYSDVITTIIHHPIPGIYDAVRRGFDGARGDVLGWINSDDLLFPWSVQCVCDYFDGNQACRWATGIPTMFDESGRMVWCAQVAPRYLRFLLRRGFYTGIGLGPVQQESVFFSRSLYDRVGGLNTNYRLAGDFDLWRRFSAVEPLHQVGTVLAGFRLHGQNRSIGEGRYWRESQAPRVPGGKVIGMLISVALMLYERRARRFRLDGAMVKM